jgi:hypothetical protein
MTQTSQLPSLLAPTPGAIEHALQQAITTTFEEMVFMEVTQADGAELDTKQVYARLDVHRPVSCTLTLQMSEQLVDACIDALYCGIESTDAVRQDIANELSNTIAGLLMSNLDDSAPIALGLPSGGLGHPEPKSGRPAVHTYHTEVGTLRVTVSL